VIEFLGGIVNWIWIVLVVVIVLNVVGRYAFA
jgi:TRAP-type mannitol/chloroaromatic compound transport system permease small subunit